MRTVHDGAARCDCDACIAADPTRDPAVKAFLAERRDIVWLWRAWAADRSRICDCGTVSASTAVRAESIAWQTLGGPWRGQVVEIQIERIGVVL